MRMQESVGRLTEAVTSLKDQSKSHGDKLENIGKDVHAAKVVISVVGGLIVLVGAICAWLINTYISTQHPK
jgi:F0F1-type ATP synthase assembly protein I